MCFSPTASFVASGALASIGTITVTRARNKKELPLASIPLLFALQQLIEGFIWLSFGSPATLKYLTYAYATFSHVLWPFFVPFAVYIIEPSRRRKRLLLAILAIGVFVSAYILYFIIRWPIEASVVQNTLSFAFRPDVIKDSIGYSYQGTFPTATMALYLLAVTLAPLFSSYRVVKLFGLALFFSAYVAYQSYEVSFFSVWCFLAAGLSAIIYLHFACGCKTFPEKILDRVHEAKKGIKKKLKN